MDYKHYIRLNENDEVIKTFSDVFEQPVEGDILYTSTGERHFNLQLLDENGFYKYTYNTSTGLIEELTENEIYTSTGVSSTGLAKYREISIEEIKLTAYNKLEATDWKVIRHRDEFDNSESTTLSSGEYTTLLGERKSIRDYSDSLESQINAASSKSEVDAIIWNDDDI